MRLENIIKKYNEKEVIKGISLDFDNNGLVFILGRSGSGKSTLLHIMGLLDKKYEGTICINNKRIVNGEKINHIDIANNIDFIFQKFNLIKNITVEENISLANCILGNEEDNERIENICKELGIEECKNRVIKNLSGGEEQRTAIVRTLYRGNNIILADEPTGSVDEENEKIIFDELKKISKDKLVIVVSHNKDAAYRYADRIIQLSEGVVVSDEDRGYSNNSRLINNNQINKGNKKNRWKWKLAISNLKNRRKKIIPAMFMTTVAMVCLGIIISMSVNINNVLTDINNNMMDNDKCVITNFYDYSNQGEISKDFLERIEAVSGIKQQIDSYEDCICIMEGENGNGFPITFFENNEFFKKRYNIISGRIPNTVREIVVSESLAYRLFGNTDVVGKSVELSSSGCELSCIISGIKENNIIKSEEIYALTDLDKEIYINDIKSFGHFYIKNQDDIDCFYMENEKNYENVVEADDFKLCYGRLPNSINEALIGIDAINKMLALYGEEKYYSTEDLYEGKLPEEDVKTILDSLNSYIIPDVDSNIFGFKIVGICSCNNMLSEDYYDTDSGHIFLQREFINKMIDYYPTINVSLYFSDRDVANKINDISKEYGYDIEIGNTQINSSISSKYTMILYLLGIVFIIFIILVFFIVAYSAKVNAMDCTYEVGVLKSLGCSEMDVLKRFFVEYIIIGFFAGIISATIGMLLSFSNILKYDGMNLLNKNVIPWIIIIIISIIVSVVSSSIENIKTSRKSIIECLKD